MYKELLSIQKTNINSPIEKRANNRTGNSQKNGNSQKWKDAQFPSHQSRPVKTRNDFSTNRLERKLRPLLTRLGGCETVTLTLPESCETCTAFLDGNLSTTTENTLHLWPAIPLSPAVWSHSNTEMHSPNRAPRVKFNRPVSCKAMWGSELSTGAAGRTPHQATCTPPSPHASLTFILKLTQAICACYALMSFRDRN